MIDALLTGVVERLAQHVYFAGSGEQKPITVLAENKRDILAGINASIGKLGACVIIGIGRLSTAVPNVPGPELSEIVLLATVHENVPVNRLATGTQQTALNIAVAVAKLLHLQKITGITLIFASIDSLDEASTLSYQVRFTASAGLDPAIPPTRSSL